MKNDMMPLDAAFVPPVKKLKALARLCGANADAQEGNSEDADILWGMECLLDDISSEILEIAENTDRELRDKEEGQDMAMSAEKRKEMRFDSWTLAHERELTMLMENPEKWEMFKKFILEKETPESSG